MYVIIVLMRVIQKKINQADYEELSNLNSLTVEKKVVFDIFIKKDKDFIIIIDAGTILSQQLYDKLKKQKKLYIFKDDKDKVGLTFKNLTHYLEFNIENYKYRIELIYTLNKKLFDDFLNSPTDTIDIDSIDKIVNSIIYLIKHDINFLKNTIPYFINEQRLDIHSLQVMIYALSLANAIHLSDKELTLLGKSAILHDLGLKNIDNKILHKKEKLTENELYEVHKHPIISTQMIKKNNIINPFIIDAVLHHHEQYNGNGYPNKLKKNHISIFASILSICDVFDALTTQRSYRKKYSSFDAIKMMFKDKSMVNAFNEHYLKVLLKLI